VIAGLASLAASPAASGGEREEIVL
jgi:hypothetical protein